MPTNKLTVTSKYGESELTESVVDLTVPGVPAATFVHITDLHVAVSEPSDTDEKKELVDARNTFWNWQSGYMSRTADGEERRLWPHEVCDIVADRIREIAPDAVFFTGDTVDFPLASSFRAVRKYLDSLGCPCVIVPGNHDTAGDDCDDADLLREFGTLFGDAKDFSADEICGIDVLSFADGFVKITKEQVDFLEAKLSEGDRPVIVLLHVPVFTESARVKAWPMWGYNWMIGEDEQSEENRRFREILYEHKDKVAAVFAGHIHAATGDEDNPSRPEDIIQYTSAPAFCGYLRVIRINGGKK